MRDEITDHKRRWSVLLVLVVSQTAFAATPVITELRPRGAEIGRPFTLTLVGRNLGEGARVTSSLPATFTTVLPSPGTGSNPALNPASNPGSMPATGRSVAFLVEPKADAAPGVYAVRLETPGGISNILLFTLGSFHEVTEEESLPNSPANRNDSIETAEPIAAVPVVVNGTLRGPERDIFRVSGKAGERRVLEVEARRCGSAIDPVLRILDGAGKQLARSDDAPGTGLDARLDFTFPKDGSYYVEVTDARFSTQVQNFYRLKMGSYYYADGIFPLGGRRGGETQVTFFGPHAGAGAHTTADVRVDTSVDTNAREGKGVVLRIGREMPADPLAYAAALYETLHRLDTQSLDWIAIEPPPDTPEWAGILDRLRRAAG